MRYIPDAVHRFFQYHPGESPLLKIETFLEVALEVNGARSEWPGTFAPPSYPSSFLPHTLQTHNMEMP